MKRAMTTIKTQPKKLGKQDETAIETTGSDNSGGLAGLEPVNSPCLLYTSPSPRDKRQSRMPSSA